MLESTFKHCGGGTVKRAWDTKKDGQWERRGGGRERSIDFPLLKPQFIILRDTLYRSPAFSLFVILATQNRSQRQILLYVTWLRDEEWRHQRMCGGNLILLGASLSSFFF